MQKVIDSSTLLGIGAALLLVAVAISMGGQNAGGFLDIKSFLIVIGGTLFLTVASFTVGDVWRAQILVLRTIFYNKDLPSRAALTALELADISRKQGVLSLQKYESLMKRNPFFYKGVNLVIDGLTHDDVQPILKNEIAAMLERHDSGASILRKAAEIAPAMGLIGTLIGLVHMLGNLSDPETIGPAMAIALLTTLYGAALSYMILTPLASKLELNSHDEALVMHIYMLAVLSIAKRENPRRLEILMNATLPPSERIRYFA